MADYMLYVATHGEDDPMRAGLVLRAAIAAAKQGNPARVALLGNAIFLMKDPVAARIDVKVAESRKPFKVKVQTMRDLVQAAKDAKVSFYV